MDVIFPDFQKAFDVVPHDKLICKLNHLGFPSFILPWITAYLMHCEQHVVIDGQQFDSSSVTSGDPQGSVLGPLLILIYCNDIVDDIQSPINISFFFADNCVIFNEINTVKDQLLLDYALNGIFLSGAINDA